MLFAALVPALAAETATVDVTVSSEGSLVVVNKSVTVKDLDGDGPSPLTTLSSPYTTPTTKAAQKRAMSTMRAATAYLLISSGALRTAAATATT
jgi:hypothetical protein